MNTIESDIENGHLRGAIKMIVNQGIKHILVFNDNISHKEAIFLLIQEFGYTPKKLRGSLAFVYPTKLLKEKYIKTL